MKIKEVSAGVKVSKNYNSYSINLVADLENEEDYKIVGNNLINEAKKILSRTDFFSDKMKKDKEVGAVWLHKKSENFLSIKFKDEKNYEDVRINELEKRGEDYLFKKDGQIYLFRKISDEKRKNNKMSLFGIYLEGKNE